MSNVWDTLTRDVTDEKLAVEIEAIDSQLQNLQAQKDRLQQLREILFSPLPKPKRAYRRNQDSDEQIASLFEKCCQLVRERGPLTSPELSQLTECSRPTISQMFRRRASGVFVRDSSKRWHLKEVAGEHNS